MDHARAGLHKIVVDALRKAPPADAPILAWPLACGQTVALRTRAVEYAAGVLRVEVPDAAWKRQLAELAPQYRAALNQALKSSVVRIEFVVPAKVKRA